MTNINETQRVFIICRGLQASGKSSFSLEWVAEAPATRTRVNRDDIRSTYFNFLWGENVDENGVTKIEHTIIETILAQGKRDIVSDNTNLKASSVKQLLALAVKYNYRVEFKDFVVPLDELIRRDSLREKKVGAEVIRNYYERFVQKDKLPPYPVLTTNSVESEQYVAVEGTPRAYIFDIDGTLARFVDRGPFDWDKVSQDEPIVNVIELARTLKAAGYKIVVTSGRDSVCREDTIAWLTLNGIEFDELFMRVKDDMRKDQVVKRELFFENIAGRYDVRGVVDDRLSVSRLWHSLGLTLFRVGDPEATF